jgi:hypothetical protein
MAVSSFQARAEPEGLVSIGTTERLLMSSIDADGNIS